MTTVSEDVDLSWVNFDAETECDVTPCDQRSEWLARCLKCGNGRAFICGPHFRMLMDYPLVYHECGARGSGAEIVRGVPL